MSDHLDKLIRALEMLKADSLKLQGNPNLLMEKYNLLFQGEKNNLVYSNELVHCLQDYFGMIINLHELNELLPSACQTLNMLCEPMRAAEKLDKEVTAAYSVQLF